MSRSMRSRARAGSRVIGALGFFFGGAQAVAAVLNQVQPSQDATELPSKTLPGADNEAWRRLAGWSRAADAQPKLIETSTQIARADHKPHLFISSGYGWRTDPLGRGTRRHEGIDLPGRLGSRVYATGPGVVSFAGWARGYGNLVQIDHPAGLRTRYGHLSEILVREGAPVAQGELIGLMGSTGRSTGSHLHYEVRVGGVAVNPLPFIGSSGSFVPHYEVEWPPLAHVTSRWLGWEDGALAAHLPEASIR